MNFEAACAFLSERSWLARTPANIRAAVFARCDMRDVQRGTSVYTIGDPPSGLWGIVRGGFALEFATDERGPHFAHSFRPGMWFGEAEVFQPRPQITTIVATRQSRCLHLSFAALEAVAREHPLVWRALGILAGAHVADALGAISDGTIREPDARLAAILLRLAGVRVHEHLSEAVPELDLTQEDLALLANLSRTSVSEHLATLEADGLISRSYGRVRILDPQRLRGMI